MTEGSDTISPDPMTAGPPMSAADLLPNDLEADEPTLAEMQRGLARGAAAGDANLARFRVELAAARCGTTPRPISPQCSLGDGY